MATALSSNAAFFQQLKKYYLFYTGGFVSFVIILAILEQMGLPPRIIGYVFLAATIALYAGIGIMSKTADVSEYYVAGRRVPALFNGMATGADWMSAASFIGMAGTLYLTGYDGLAFVMGWTGGYVLVALFLAPYLRKFGQFTIPDFLGARYGGNLPRTIGVVAAIICSFTYVIAQIYGVGIITSRFTGLSFGVGVYAGLAGILVCSFLGGMRAVTWTQVAQYIILIFAYMIPVVWLSVNITGNPIPQIAYGQALQGVTAKEKELNDPTTVLGAAEASVRALHKEKAAEWGGKLKALNEAVTSGNGAAFLAEQKALVQAKLDELKAAPEPDAKKITTAEEDLKAFPANVAALKAKWVKAEKGAKAKSGPIAAHAEPFSGKGAEKKLLKENPAATPEEIAKAKAEDEKASNSKRNNFIALVLCLMVGTASLPHILMRYYTTPSVRDARKSVFWSLFFIFLLYFTAPALAVLAKYEVYHHLVGSSFAALPAWVSNWQAVDATLMKIVDMNKDGLIQLAEITIGGDLIVLATPEIAGLPYVISGLVAAGGLAAALSTADGLLLTIANALSHDVYYKMIDPSASTLRRLSVSKALLLVVAVLAAYVTSLKPGDILFLVGAAFSLAASAFFPALVLGVFWKRANHLGAVIGMLAGLGLCMYYMYMTYDFFGVNAPLWFDIKPISAGIFGMSAGFLGVIVGSLVSPAPSKEVQALVDHVRYPSLTGDINTNAA
ncbi:MAG: cation acetate symporter [Hydrogenophilales bacterium CG17_big_fil_post_rev_8_21_14_2_50_63_12]|nr:MAG: cation acetate symporter [Hydrogenophilales bacterium CG17_big_fil_post_rev_8_21_14_2_50_63_12]PIX95701.1 MAG: cation acetate symporter [Hydrogenophilales bacterium CG_4_10_14_3_um_filter_63_21]PJB05336.1 MAG: cation acetate symporter [Hydrogenophilales bacterium CG_4_9_14_3_um_filter_63_34]